MPTTFCIFFFFLLKIIYSVSPVQFTRYIGKAKEKKKQIIIIHKQRNNWYKRKTEQNKSKQNCKNDNNKIIHIRVGF